MASSQQEPGPPPTTSLLQSSAVSPVPRMREKARTMLEEVHAQLRRGDSLELTLAIRTTPPSTRTYRFPGQTSIEAFSFTCVLKVLDIVYEALVTGVTVTKRDVYYKHTELFKTQAVVDRIVDDLAATFAVARSGLGVIAAAKGLVAGQLRIDMEDGSSIDCSAATTGALIPQRYDISKLTFGVPVKIILLVEKEAVFHSLVPHMKRHTSVLLVTGKGYPDISTRSFLKLLSDTTNAIILGLVDYDPYGIEILMTYTHGSIGMAHSSEELVVPQIQWLGLKNCDVAALVQEQLLTIDGHDSAGEQFLIRLTPRDRCKALAMLKRDSVANSPVYRPELQRMLSLGYKAEIEILDHLENQTLQDWVVSIIPHYVDDAVMIN